tara:strand:- start:27 stop:626 length:600 start_codon:yes stop_codon:yes gene_type:complete
MYKYFKPIKKHDPFNYWLFENILSKEIINTLCNLKIGMPLILKNDGTREANNESRVFFNKHNCNLYPIFKKVVNIFKDKNNINELSLLTKSNLNKGKLRIEYAIDYGNFWLTKHTDIDDKLLTFLIYLNDSPSNQHWGTTLYNSDYSLFGNCPHGENIGMMFVPGKNTIHGFEKRNIIGKRKSLIINYVLNWKHVQELS